MTSPRPSIRAVGPIGLVTVANCLSWRESASEFSKSLARASNTALGMAETFGGTGNVNCSHWALESIGFIPAAAAGPRHTRPTLRRAHGHGRIFPNRPDIRPDQCRDSTAVFAGRRGKSAGG